MSNVRTLAPFLVGELVYPVVRGSEYDACGCCGGDRHIVGKDGRTYTCPDCKGEGKQNRRPSNWEVGERAEILEIRVNHGGTFVLLDKSEDVIPVKSVSTSKESAEAEADRRNSARRIGAA